MFVYVVTPDCRERNSSQVLLVTTDINKAYKRMRQYIIGMNRDQINRWLDPRTRAMSDREFVHDFCSAWRTSPGLHRKKLK